MATLNAATIRMSHQNPMFPVIVGGCGCVSPDAAPLNWPCQEMMLLVHRQHGEPELPDTGVHH